MVYRKINSGKEKKCVIICTVRKDSLGLQPMTNLLKAFEKQQTFLLTYHLFNKYDRNITIVAEKLGVTRNTVYKALETPVGIVDFEDFTVQLIIKEKKK